MKQADMIGIAEILVELIDPLRVLRIHVNDFEEFLILWLSQALDVLD